MVPVVTEEVVEVEVGHLVDLADHLGAEVVAQQVIDQAAALLGLDPELTELIEVVGLGDHPLDHLAAVFVHRYRRVATVPAGEDASDPGGVTVT